MSNNQKQRWSREQGGRGQLLTSTESLIWSAMILLQIAKDQEPPPWYGDSWSLAHSMGGILDPSQCTTKSRLIKLSILCFNKSFLLKSCSYHQDAFPVKHQRGKISASLIQMIYSDKNIYLSISTFQCTFEKLD